MSLRKTVLGHFISLFHKRLNNRTDISPLYDKDGHIVSDSLSNVRLLNEYFVFVRTADDGLFHQYYFLYVVTVNLMVYC